MSTTVAERILLRLSRPPRTPEPSLRGTEWTVENALDSIEANFPAFQTMYRGRSVLDFGCGYGYQAVALALGGATRVLGIDINEFALERGRELSKERGADARVSFHSHLDQSARCSFDLVISQNSMEHFPDPLGVLRDMRSALRPGGRIVILFSAPWYSPYGSHMDFFTRVPWVNLLFSERTVMGVRSRNRSDGALRYEDGSSA